MNSTAQERFRKEKELTVDKFQGPNLLPGTALRLLGESQIDIRPTVVFFQFSRISAWGDPLAISPF